VYVVLRAFNAWLHPWSFLHVHFLLSWRHYYRIINQDTCAFAKKEPQGYDDTPSQWRGEGCKQIVGNRVSKGQKMSNWPYIVDQSEKKRTETENENDPSTQSSEEALRDLC
jgi:hypothetical protein